MQSAAGNPVNWRNDISSLTWTGKTLTKLVIGSISTNCFQYKYDSSGLRTYKANNIDRIISNYDYDSDGRLLLEDRSGYFKSDKIYYLYDASGVCGFKYVCGSYTNTYYFGKNAQGDVMEIYDANGTKVVTYTYDAWGNVTVNSDTSGHDIGNINPIRYRSYYYDVTSRLYYLQTRYYDPAVGRFLNADSALNLGANGDVLSYNLYLYCSNNPVNFTDPTGEAWYNVLGWIGLGLVVAAATVITAGMAGAVIGGVAGGIIYGAAIGILAGAAVGAVGGAVGGMIYDGIAGNSFGTSIWSGVKAGFGIGAIAGAIIGGAIGGAAASSVSGLNNVAFWSKTGADGAAAAANAQGLTTIGQTFGGNLVGALSSKLPYAFTKPMWIVLSKTAATTVTSSSITFFMEVHLLRVRYGRDMNYLF